ncbi:hypothetical protein SKAU_G00181480 [Synaphobranchus kaupii]|uniref:Rho-GAP domain-containing protein n=1 Tax=Synaphobranchus kaupii TaxID=118154 RepID=A0A9Q1J1D2_SYNKA|nr:hypothetical protein SKAU_G00181480 [Synaphobranchus kaupii]
MGTSASFTLFKAPSSSKIKKATRKIQPKPPSLHSGPVFGVSLAVLRETGQLVRGIPWVLRDMVEFLDRHALHQKGLFRLSGSVVKTSLLKARCDRGEALDLSAGEDFQNVASLLKLFLREIPLAVIPCPQRTEMVRCFRECSDERVMNHTLKEKLSSLPEDNHNVLSYLCHFLLKVASHSHLNHMSVENLATIFGPCLFHVPYGPNMLEEQSLCNAVVCHLLKNYSYLMSGDLDTPSPPPALLALSAHEETAIEHVPSFWPHAWKKGQRLHCTAQKEDEANRLKLSADVLSAGCDSVAPTDATPELESAAPENRERPGQDRTLRPQRPTSGSGHFSGRQEGFCQTWRTSGGNAGVAANRDLRTPGSPHTDRVEHILTEDNQMPQACDKGSLLKLQAVEEEACPSAVTRREDAGQTASPTPAPPETGVQHLPIPYQGEFRSPPTWGALFHMVWAMGEILSPRPRAPMGRAVRARGPRGPAGSCSTSLTAPARCPPPRCASLSQSQRFHSDPEAAPSPPCSQPFIKARPIARTQFPEGSADTLSITMLTKHIQTLKRKIRRFEEQFEQERNYRPSHNDKTVNPEVFQLMSDLAKSRKQLRDLRLKQSVEQMRAQKMEEHADMCRYSGDLQGAPEQSHKPSLEDTLEALLKRLRDKRQALGLPDNMKEMTQKQMALEKITLQKCLLYFESLHGRPGTRQERTLMKPLYDRYRTIKQLLCAVSTITTIAEEEGSKHCVFLYRQKKTALTMTAHSAARSPPAERYACSALDESACPQEEDSDATFVSPLDEVKAVRQPAGTVSNLHEASRSELLQCLRETRLEKKKLRKGLREFEEQFYRQMGRSAQKDDRIPMAEEYQEYKNLKAKLRLLEALLSKQETPKII